MSDSKETISGMIPVSTKLSLGSERLRLYFTSSRIIVTHVGKRGAGAVTGTNLLGSISSALENLFKDGRESIAKRGREELSPRQLLLIHKDNFSIDYAEIIQARIEQSTYVNRITILTGGDKFDFTTSQGFRSAAELMQTHLGEKLTATSSVESSSDTNTTRH
jgi:hypothetical protein